MQVDSIITLALTTREYVKTLLRLDAFNEGFPELEAVLDFQSKPSYYCCCCF